MVHSISDFYARHLPSALNGNQPTFTHVIFIGGTSLLGKLVTVQGLSMKLLPLLIGNRLVSILLTGNTLPRLLFSSGLMTGQKVLRKSLTLIHQKLHYYA